MKKNKIKLIAALCFTMIFAIGLPQPGLSSAAVSSTNYDFGSVLVGSTQMHAFGIKNLEDTSTTLTEFVFDHDNCRDFSLIAKPESLMIPPNGTIQVVVGYTPSATGTCSDIMRIYADSPVPYSVTLTGTGIQANTEEPGPSEEPVPSETPVPSEEPEPVDESLSYSTQMKKIKSFHRKRL